MELREDIAEIVRLAELNPTERIRCLVPNSLNAWIYVHIYIYIYDIHVFKLICVYTCMSMYIYICIYLYIYIERESTYSTICNPISYIAPSPVAARACLVWLAAFPCKPCEAALQQGGRHHLHDGVACPRTYTAAWLCLLSMRCLGMLCSHVLAHC